MLLHLLPSTLTAQLTILSASTNIPTLFTSTVLLDKRSSYHQLDENSLPSAPPSPVPSQTVFAIPSSFLRGSPPLSHLLQQSVRASLLSNSVYETTYLQFFWFRCLQIPQLRARSTSRRHESVPTALSDTSLIPLIRTPNGSIYLSYTPLQSLQSVESSPAAFRYLTARVLVRILILASHSAQLARIVNL